MYVDQLGDTIITLKRTGERFEVSRPRLSVHNLIMGELFVWTEGKASCRNVSNGYQASLELPSIGFLKKRDS